MDFDEIDYLEKTVENPEGDHTVKRVDETVKPEDNGLSWGSKHRSGVRDHDSDHRSKCVKSGDDRYDHDRHRKRSLLRHHCSFSKDGEKGEGDRHRSKHRERNRDKGREERNGRDRHKNRGREREQGLGRHHDWKEQDRETEKGSEKERKEWDQEGYRERNKERERDRENEHSRRSRSHSERHSSRNDSDRENELKEREKERELKERENRYAREIFRWPLWQLSQVQELSYIEFYDAMSVPMAIALSGQPLLSQPVMVKPSEAEKNFAQSTTAASSGPAGVVGTYSGGERRLYVGNLHFTMTKDQLRQVFEPFGTVELVQLPLDLETGQCKGFGFIQFGRLEDARAAESLNGQLDIAGRIIKVSAVTDQTGMQDVGANAADFDDDEGGGLVSIYYAVNFSPDSVKSGS